MKHAIIDIAVILAIAAAFVLLVGGCKSVQVVTVPEYHTITVHDTIATSDSIYIHTREYIKGDTIRKDSIVYRDRWRDKVVEINKTDSIPYEVIVEKPVPHRTGYDRFCSWAFWIILVATIIYWAAKIAYKIYFRR